MYRIKKIICVALAVILTAGALLYAPGDVLAKRRTKKVVVKKKSGLSAKQMADYKEAVTAVVVLEKGIVRYDLRKPENLQYAKVKAIIARAAVSKVVPGSSKNGLLSRVISSELTIKKAELNNQTNKNVTVESFESIGDIVVDEGSKFDLPRTVRAKMSDGSIKDLEVRWNKLVDTSKVGEVILTGRVDKSDKSILLKVIVRNVKFGLENMVPLNLKEIKMEFTKPIVDEQIRDNIKDKDNYRLYDQDKDEINDAIKEVRIDESNKFATIILSDKTDSKGKHYIIENGERYSLTIDSNVFGREIKDSLKFTDTTLPKVEDIEITGEDTIKIKFSEPIKPYNLEDIDRNKNILPELDRDDFRINDGDISIKKVELLNDNRTANIVTSSRFRDDERIEVKVNGSVHDYAGLSVISEKKELRVRKNDNPPEVVDFKNIENNEVTLIFDKDIRFRGTSASEISKNHNSYYLQDFYHSSDNRYNRASRVTINGNELRLVFEESDLPTEGYVYIKSDVLESRWNVKNSKISTKVRRSEDNERPEVVSVEQEKDAANKIRIKFSEKVNLNENRDYGARYTRNYILKDNNGKEWRINRITQNGDSEREFIIYTSRDFNTDLEYELTIENVEDRAGNAIRRVTKYFKVRNVKPVNMKDVLVTVHNSGESNQSIIVDFDTRMLTDNSRYSAIDIGKYTLMAYEADGKTPKKFFRSGTSYAINVDNIYRCSISSVKNGKAVEIRLPYRRDREYDNSYDLSRIPVLKVEIARVSDENENVTSTAMRLFAKNIATDLDTWIGFDVKPEAVSVDEIRWVWKDEVNFNIDDIKIIAANNSTDAQNLANLSLEGKLNKSGTSDAIKGARLLDIRRDVVKYTSKDYTEVTIGLEKQGKNPEIYDEDYLHVLTYDGKFIDNDGSKKPVYLVVVPSERNRYDRNETRTKNDYNTPVKVGVFEIKDAIAPKIVDNNIRNSNYRYIGYNVDKAKEYGHTYNRDEAVEFWQQGEHAAIVLTFEENIDTRTLATVTFELNDKYSDFGDAKINKVFAKDNRVIIELVNVKYNDKPLSISEGAEIEQRNSFSDENNNDIDGLRVNIVGFKKLSNEDINNLGIVTINSIKKVVIDKDGKLPDKVTGILSDGKEIEKNVKWLESVKTDVPGILNTKVLVDGNEFNVQLEVRDVKVKLLQGSLGIAGDKKIMGLEIGKIYIVEEGTNKYGVKADGTLGLESEAAKLTVTEIKGLDNEKSYKVIEKQSTLN